MTSKVAKQNKQEPAEPAEKPRRLQRFSFPELGISVDAATLEEAIEIANTKRRKNNG